jgi:hypothetical protein
MTHEIEVAGWADQVRGERQETAPWHYVDIPLEANAFDAARDGVVAFETVLSASPSPYRQREEVLKFLVHFVGDMHQPLHCAERNNDKGGNMRLVFFLDEPEAQNLHGV